MKNCLFSSIYVVQCPETPLPANSASLLPKAVLEAVARFVLPRLSVLIGADELHTNSLAEDDTQNVRLLSGTMFHTAADRTPRTR